MNQCVIYGLIDPFTNQLRYVGKSKDLCRRKTEYVRYKKAPKRHVEKWVNSLITKGVVPDIEILEELEDPKKLNELEKFYIAYFKSLGCNLCNHTDGGEGMCGFQYTYEQNLENSKRQGGKNFIDQNGNVYYSPIKAAEKLGLSHAEIRSILKEQSRIAAKGYTFSYIEENTNIPELAKALSKIVEAWNKRKSLKILSNEGLVFNTMQECANHYNVLNSHISQCCSGTLYKAKKNSFCFYNEEKDDKELLLKELDKKLNYRNSDEFKRKQASDRGTKPFADEDGNFFYSIAEAANFWKLERSGIRRILQGKQQAYKKHTFSYAIQ